MNSVNKGLRLSLGLLLCAGGCSLAPEYARPDAPIPTAWPSGDAYPQTQPAAGTPAATELEWQKFITDEKLRKIIAMALQNNRDLRLATLNVQRARALYNVQRNELYPTFNAAASASRRHASDDLTQPGQPRTTRQYNVDFGIAAWEIDFFGRIRNLSEAALQDYFATEQAARSAHIMLVSGVSSAYFALAADRENLKLAQTTLQTQQGVYDLIKKRFERGVGTELDVYQVQTQVDTARGDVAQFVQFVAQGQNALNLLVGSPVPADLLPTDQGEVSPPADISPGTSSEVLLRRPDILQAESLLKAAYANIGAARAAFFPRISLTAAIGTASDELSGLFNASSGTWSYAPQAVTPIFDARTWSAYEVAKAQREIAVAQYEKAIQTSFREVADALATRGMIGEQVSAQESLVHAVSETYRLSMVRYDKGRDSYLSVLDAQKSLYSAQRGLVILRLARLVNQVRLYAVLGGGWNAQAPSAELATTPKP